MSSKRLATALILAALGLCAAGASARAAPMWVGDCWGIGLRSKAGRDLLRRSNINYVKILARVEYMEGDIARAFSNPRHRPWPWFDPNYRESLDSLLCKAAALELKVDLCLDPGASAASRAFRERLRQGGKTPDEGSAWLFADPQTGFSERQIRLYAELFARAAAYCEKAHPGLVRWIEVGNELRFPDDNYRRLVEAVVGEVKKRNLEVLVIADALQGRLPRDMASGQLPDILGFHHLPAFAAPGSKYPSQAEVVRELRRALNNKRSYRGRPVQLWADKWNPCLKSESMSDAAVAQRVLDLLQEQQRLGIQGSAFVTFCLDARHTDRGVAWALSWTDGTTSPLFNLIAAKVKQLVSESANPS